MFFSKYAASHIDYSSLLDMYEAGEFWKRENIYSDVRKTNVQPTGEIW